MRSAACAPSWSSSRLALVRVVPLPIDPADALLLWCLGVTGVLWLLGRETGREVAVIVGCHLVGLALALLTVAQGAWSCPDTGVATIGGVPLCSGFRYAAVGSHVCQARRRLDLRVTRRTWVPCTVARRRYAMPLALPFVLIGCFLRAAENAATFLRARQYPSQEPVWTAAGTRPRSSGGRRQPARATTSSRPARRSATSPEGSVTAAESTLTPMQHWSSCEMSVIIAAQPGSGPNGNMRTMRDPAM